MAACERYLDRLPLNAETRHRLLRHVAASEEATDTASAMICLHQALAGDGLVTENPAGASVGRRLELAYGKPVNRDAEIAEQTTIPPDSRHVAARLVSPPISRTSMAPGPWPPRPFLSLLGKCMNWLRIGDVRRNRLAGNNITPDSPDPRGHWQRNGHIRRFALLFLIIAQTALATYFMTAVLPYHGEQPLEIAMLVLFAILSAWVSAGFWTAIMGFLILQFGGDRYAISATTAADAPIGNEARTAIVMPICNEHVSRVFAGLKATYESLAHSGNLEHFDFYVLSDSNDPDLRVAETQAWQDLCRRVGGFGRIFYRWRQHRIKRKSGNIADFCRRWGGNYRYMVILDADSVMTGDCLSALVRMMEANPSAGIIQTAPHAAGRDTFYARLQQFASRVYGPLFVTGLHFWQLGESHYWGHNAIIRVAPFIRHCALGRLPGKGSLSGEILSHDFVEAALMRRAGWAVWIAYDLPGSYEEMPPNLVDELQRDRRWCHGNLMNFRLLLAPGFHMAHRAVFATGMIAYVSAFLWFLFLLLSTWMLAQHTLVEPEYFVQPKQLFPVWPEWHPERAVALFTATATWLFLPKLLSVLLIAAQGAQRFGGMLRLLVSMLTEWLFSMLMAPIRMLFHTQFVLASLTGWRIHWQSPPREDATTSWDMAFRRHGAHTLFGVLWAALVYWINPSFLWWLLPIVGALMLSIPISVYSSSPLVGRWLRKMGFLLIPEESAPPAELRMVYEEMEYADHRQPDFVEAVTDPNLNALVCAFAPSRPFRHDRQRLVDLALKQGPLALSKAQRMILLSDAWALSHLHLQIWASTAAHQDWFKPKTMETRAQSFSLDLAKPAYA